MEDTVTSLLAGDATISPASVASVTPWMLDRGRADRGTTRLIDARSERSVETEMRTSMPAMVEHRLDVMR